MRLSIRLLVLGLLVSNSWPLSADGGRQSQVGVSRMNPPAEIFRLVSNCEFIAIGTVTNSRPVMKNLSPEELRELKDVSKPFGGILYTFNIETLLSAKSDFRPGFSRPVLNGGNLLIFKEYKARFLKEDTYQMNSRYLMFFTPLPDQARLPAVYKLEKGITYYEAFEGKKGVIQLPSDNIPFVNKLKKFSDALSPSSKEQKIALLRSLASSSDVELSESAKEAIKLLTDATRR